MTIETKYLNRFLNGNHGLALRGNHILVELLPKEEVKTAGGLIVATQSDFRTNTKDNQADVAVVLATGPGYYDDTADGGGADVALDIKPGNVILLSRYGIRTYSNFPGISDFIADSIAMCRDTDVHAKWDSLEAYEVYKKALADAAPQQS